ncbi:MAG: SNF2 helicase associated domain-containing protein [Planctomycetaceae bacterium]|nr:SNF2 helicase associated domain-containing protein [Planctomycetaceae bacterium]
MADKTFSSLIRGEFSKAHIRNGEQYFFGGHVKLVEAADDHVHYTVSGSAADPYDVVFAWESSRGGRIASICTCPAWEDWGICKHQFAAALMVDLNSQAPASVLAHAELHLEPSEALLREFGLEDDYADDYDDDEDVDDRTEIIAEHLAKSLTARPASTASKSKTKSDSTIAPKPWSWQQILKANAPMLRAEPTLQPVTGLSPPREAWFVIPLAECQSTLKFKIHLYYRERKLNGEWGKIRLLSASPGQINLFGDPEDRAILDWVARSAFGDHSFGSSYYSAYASSVSRIVVPEAMLQAVLPRLCARGRLLGQHKESDSLETAQPLHIDPGPEYQFRMPVTRTARNQPWTVTGELFREGETLPCTEAHLVLPDGTMWIENRLARVACQGHLTWLAMLRRLGSLEVPAAHLDDFVAQCWQLGGEPPLVLPPEADWKFHDVEPRSLVRFKPHAWDKDKLNVTAEFHYGKATINAQADSPSLIDRDERQIIRRDRMFELNRLQELSSFGMNEDRYDRKFLGVMPTKRLANAIPQLMARGWQVEAEGKLIRTAGNFKFNVTTGVDWFDLEGQCDFNGQVVQLPELLKALRQGKKFITLGDGTQGMLPEKWLEKFGAVVGLGEADGTAVRFRRSQGMLLDALLAAQEQQAIDIDRAFSKFRQQIASFAGITPGKEPKTFQGELREYQRVGLGWFQFLTQFGLGGCLADDMGLGKTIQVLALLESRRAAKSRANGERLPSAIVVPRSLVHNWLEEASRFTPKLRVVNFSGADRGKVLPTADNADLIVTTYGILRQDIELFSAASFDYAILDEAQAIKNADSQAAKASRLLKATHRLALTGTPVENRLSELWSIVEFLNPGMLGQTQTFRQSLGNSRATDDDTLALVARAVRPILLRRTKSQVLTELPEKTEQTLYCELEKPQRRLYNELRDHYRAALDQKIATDGLAKSKIVVLEALLRLRQAACHPGLLDPKRVKDKSAKLDCLLEQLREVTAEGHKVLVFSQFTSLLAIVKQQFDAEKIRHVYLDGKTRKRQEVVDQFQNDPAISAFLISLKAGGVGLNLTAADYVFILDPWWNPAVEAQAVDRAHRIGQAKRVFAYRLIARDTVEEKILQLQGDKRRLADAIVSADDSVIRQLTAEDLQLLLS